MAGFRRKAATAHRNSDRRDRPMKSAEVPDYLSDDYQSKKSQKRRNFWKLIKWPIYMAFGVGAAFLLFRSYNIYQQFFASAGLGSIGRTCTALRPFPFFGWLLQAGCDNVAQFIIASIALIVLIALSCLMSIPVLLHFHPQAIADMVDQLRDNKRGHQPLSASNDDDAQVRYLVKRHQSLPKGALKTLNVLSVAAFLLEFWMVYTVRGRNAGVITMLVDSIGLEMLLVAFFSFRNAFLAKPVKVRVVN